MRDLKYDDTLPGPDPDGGIEMTDDEWFYFQSAQGIEPEDYRFALLCDAVGTTEEEEGL